jgi:hypothetical protein
MSQQSHGGTPVTAENYKPKFIDNVTTTSMNGLVTPINWVYCLTKESAKELAHILADLHPVIIMAEPQGPTRGVTISQEVPWFKFPSGCAVNAGTEGNWWSHASGAPAEKNCRLDIQAAEEQFQLEGDAQYPDKLQGAYKA